MAGTDTGPATMKEVARLAGVALSSVSRVLNKHPDVSASMRTRVLAAVEELGYEPDLLASSLRRGSTRTIGFIVSDIVNPLFADILNGAERHLRNEGYSVLLAHSEGQSTRDAESARLLRRRRVDGLILSLADETRRETIEELDALDMPVVLLDRSTDVLPRASAVLANHRTGMRRATEHLLDLGHRRIGLIAGSLNTRPTRERLQGFGEGCERRSAQVPEDLLRFGPFAAEFGQRATKELIRLPDPPTALIAGGNLVFVGIIAALHQMGIAAGRELALVTCDDIPLTQFHTPPITVVGRNTTEMGAIAARLMLERLQTDDPGPRVEVVPTELIVRESTFPLR
jgi:LacI family transcriptional regulator